MIKKVLIANRGEIAVRIIRACREMNIKTVVIYSDADRLALHTRMGDEAYRIGEAPSTKSYLLIDKIIETAKESKADAIHPGYGFLAENAEFAEKVESAGIVFIGSTPESISSMGDKVRARELMSDAKVPVVPGTKMSITDIEEAKDIAGSIGYPILIKARAGGGGKGMRVVHDEDEFKSSVERAQSESLSAFGVPDVYFEKYLENPRHIEFQILADNNGNTVHLLERECSIQRRHQKVIEESPCVIMTEDLRKRMGEDAIKAAKACGYRNAGTVEFLVDKDRNYYFLEMNTRLQVEHPVTEIITGIDIVKEQIRIASGESLRFSQNEIEIRGHAVECRIYAEDPENDFFPSTGSITYLREPKGGRVRIDSGFEQDGEVGIYYDPLIAKLIVWGADRPEAIENTKRALGEYKITGLKTNLSFCQFIMKNKKFKNGNFDTGFIAQEFEGNTYNELTEEEEIIIAVGAALYKHSRQNKLKMSLDKTKKKQISKWKLAGMNRRLNN